MLKYRLFYAFTLAAVFIFYAAYEPWFSWFLLVFVLILVPLDLVISLPGMLSKSIKLSAPQLLEKDATGVLTLTVINEKPYPVRCLYAGLRVTGDDFVTNRKVIIPAGTGSSCDVAIDTTRTGLMVFMVEKLYTVSLLGLFSGRVKTRSKVSVLILPSARKPKNALALPRSLILKPKPGGGYSEEHDMREYLPGDPVRSIHWKLSAKYDSLIIREPLIPPQHSRLVHIVPWKSAAQRDNTLAHLRWVSGFLIDKGLTFYIKFGERLLIEEINTEADLIDFLRRVLDNSTVMKPVHYPKITRFSWVFKVTGDN